MTVRDVASRYNFYYPLEGGTDVLAYNSLANSL
jgi:hypothetical protein